MGMKDEAYMFIKVHLPHLLYIWQECLVDIHETSEATVRKSLVGINEWSGC